MHEERPRQSGTVLTVERQPIFRPNSDHVVGTLIFGGNNEVVPRWKWSYTILKGDIVTLRNGINILPDADGGIAAIARVNGDHIEVTLRNNNSFTKADMSFKAMARW